MSDDDQYREYGSSNRDRPTPGYLQSMINAFSGTGRESHSSLAKGEEDSQDETSAAPELNSELVGTSVVLEDVRNAKISKK
jgi:hypothetical protein